MVLTENYTKKIFPNVDIWHEYILISNEVVESTAKRKRFEHVIGLLEVIDTIYEANAFLESTGSDQRINVTSMFKAIDAIYKDKSFNDQELAEYVKTLVDLDEFRILISVYKDIDFYTPHLVDFHLAGYSFKEQRNVPKNELSDLREKMHTVFYYNEDDDNIEQRVAKIKRLISLAKMK
jgi:hypothetical protein